MDKAEGRNPPIVLLATPGATISTIERFCTYALTDKYLLVQSWDIASTKYVPIMRLDFAQLTSVGLAYSNVSKQVKLLEPQRLTGISAAIDEGGRVDKDATERIFETIKAQGIPATASGDERFLRAPPDARPAPMMVPIVVPRRR